MKKTYLIYSLVLLNVSLACSQKENHPPIEDSNKDLYSLEKIVDGIDIPWGMSFTSTNSFLVTDKKGIMYHVSEGKKDIVDGKTSQCVVNILIGKVRQDIERYKKVRAHRGIRHYFGHRVRGQHTCSTGRKGKVLGMPGGAGAAK